MNLEIRQFGSLRVTQCRDIGQRRHCMNAYEAAKKSGIVEEIHHQLLELAKEHNTRTGGGTSIPRPSCV